MEENKMKISILEIKRHGKTILLGQGYTATENYSTNLPQLTIRWDGKVIARYQGSSLYFSKKLSDEDKEYLGSLAERS